MSPKLHSTSGTVPGLIPALWIVESAFSSWHLLEGPLRHLSLGFPAPPPPTPGVAYLCWER